MKRIQLYGVRTKEFIYPLPTVLIVNYANRLELQLSWLVFNVALSFLKKGWY